MTQRELLFSRLDAIGANLARSGDALALLGLGSVGIETSRLDEFSDLDFFVIVQPGSKRLYLGDLGWLSDAGERVWTFRNTVDGYKILFADGVYGECAVFEPNELSAIPFAEGRVVWKAPGVDDAIRFPMRGSEPRRTPDVAWCAGEAISCLHVGLKRFMRGEHLSAQRLVQHHAVDRVVELAELIEQATEVSADPFSAERRFEQRYPGVARSLPDFVQGYEKTPESALAILEFLERRFDVNAAMAAEVRRSIDDAIRRRDAG